jgi:hypothetical protein
MIDAKVAIYIAKQKAAEVLDQSASRVEEIERDSYKGRDVWSITLSFPRDPNQPGTAAQYLAQLSDPLQYKRFLIDVDTEELLAVKIREVASQ